MAVTFPRTLQDRAELYANALDEVRRRLNAITELQRSQVVPPLFTQEFCHLMLRLSCECFAVGCLAAQGDFEKHKAFRDEYTPSLIFKALETSYPDFFPVAASLTRRGKSWHLDMIITRPIITRSALEALWNRSGDHLHRASAKRYVKRTNTIEFDAVNKAAEEFWNLISEHAIPLATTSTSRRTFLYAKMDRESDDMALAYLHFDKKMGTLAIEHFTVVAAKVGDRKG